MALARAVRITAVIAIVLSLAQVGLAQSTGSVRPFHGLFGPTQDEQSRPQVLDVNWSLYGAQDDNSFLSNDADVLDSTLQANRTYSGANIALAYTRRPPRKVITVAASSAARFYPDLHRIVSTRYSGGATLEVIPADHWQIQTAGTVSYSPYYQVVLGASPAASGLELPTPNADYAAARQDSMTYGSFIGARRTFSPTSGLSMSYGLRYLHFLGAAQYADQRAGFRYTRAVSKSFSLNLGYSHSAVMPVRGSTESTVQSSNIDIGLGYNRTLFSSSRTSLSFTSGTSTVSTVQGSQFMLTGTARLARQLSRLWSAQLLYDRGVQVPEGTLRPFFSDTVTGNVSGYMSSRVMLRALPSYAHGTVGIGAAANAYNSIANTTRLEIALGRQVALYVEHFYYRYAFANNADLPPMLAGGLNRKGARVGMTLWTPVIR
jgi:hypothetical protein